jgi:hypothetical protein
MYESVCGVVEEEEVAVVEDEAVVMEGVEGTFDCAIPSHAVLIRSVLHRRRGCRSGPSRGGGCVVLCPLPCGTVLIRSMLHSCRG